MALAVLGEYYLRNNDIERATGHAQRALQLNREHPYIRETFANTRRAAANAALGAGQHDTARDAIMSALELFPENIPLLSDLIGIETAAGRTEEAQRIVERIRSQSGGEEQARIMHAYIQEQQGDFESATRTLQELWQGQRNAAVADRLYQLHQRAGTDATGLLTDWAQRYPRDPRPVTYLALAAQVDGRQQEAIRYYQQAIELAPNNALILNNLAWLYHEVGDDRAAELARRAVELAPNNPAILDTYGWVLVNTGSVHDGIRYLEQAAALAPEAEDIRKHLEHARTLL